MCFIADLDLLDSSQVNNCIVIMSKAVDWDGGSASSDAASSGLTHNYKVCTSRVARLVFWIFCANLMSYLRTRMQMADIVSHLAFETPLDPGLFVRCSGIAACLLFGNR